MAMVGATASITYLLLYLALAIGAQYTDDSDYNDFDLYEDLPLVYTENLESDQPNDAVQDDFYILSDFEDLGKSRHRDRYRNRNRLSLNDYGNQDVFAKRNVLAGYYGWYKPPERIYRYTKHRIPGYDYDELDYVAGGDLNERCDERSSWTHCLCQFTCSEQNVVDCYTPCKSGCECKEEYVFDEKAERCSLPEECSSPEEALAYEK